MVPPVNLFFPADGREHSLCGKGAKPLCCVLAICECVYMRVSTAYGRVQQTFVESRAEMWWNGKEIKG